LRADPIPGLTLEKSQEFEQLRQVAEKNNVNPFSASGMPLGPIAVSEPAKRCASPPDSRLSAGSLGVVDRELMSRVVIEDRHQQNARLGCCV
jgi:hypothetical protein